MKAAGIDAGSLTVKAVILNQSGILAAATVPSGDSVEESARAAIGQALQQAALPEDTQLYIVSTGTGGKSLSANQHRAITTCLARGINHLAPSARMGIDIGAESSTIVKVTDKGSLNDWISHDKCAAGTGMFLQAMAKIMRVTLDEMSSLSTQAKSRADITGTCAVFAESEVISHIHRVPPTPKADIVAGIYASVISRLMTLCKRIGITRDIAVVGGVAANRGLVTMLEQELGCSVIVPERPEQTAALGAAIIARSQIENGA